MGTTTGNVRLTDELRREHDALLGSLTALERIIHRGDTDAAHGLLEWLRETLDEHRVKEDAVLVPRLREHLGPQAPAATKLLKEHESEERVIERFVAALESGELQAYRGSGLALIDHIRTHIRREENILFPMIERPLNDVEREGVQECFERVTQSTDGGEM